MKRGLPEVYVCMESVPTEKRYYNSSYRNLVSVIMHAERTYMIASTASLTKTVKARGPMGPCTFGPFDRRRQSKTNCH